MGGFRLNRFGCPLCGGKLAKAQARYGEGGKVKNINTDYYFCIKCKKMTKVKIVVNDD